MALIRLKWLLFIVLSAALLPPPVHSACLDQDDKDVLLVIKREVLYSPLTFQRGVEVLSGAANPLQRIDWKSTVLLNFPVLPDKVRALEECLPQGFSLSRTKMLKDDPRAFHYLTVSIKLVDVIGTQPGETITTTQVDWMVYVETTDDSEATFMILDSKYDFDLLSPLGSVLATSLSLQEDNAMYVCELDEDTSKLTLTLDKDGLEPASLDADLIKAFDKLYYQNSIYSVFFANGSIGRGDVLAETRQDSGATDTKKPLETLVKFEHDTVWSEFVTSDPRQVIYFPEPINLGQELFVNAVDVDEEFNTAKNLFYSTQLFNVEGPSVLNGLLEPVAILAVEAGNTPAYYMNFRIRPEKLDDMAAAIPLPEGFTLSPIQARSRGPREMIITLNVYEVNLFGIPAFRAEWSVFVTVNGQEADGPRYMVVEAVSSVASFDPVNLFTPPANAFEHKVESGEIISSYDLPGGISFSTSFPDPQKMCELPDMAKQSANCDIPALEFIVANDEIYWANGIYDRTLYDGNLWELPLSIVDPKRVNVDISTTKWAEFVDSDISDLFVFTQRSSFFLQPSFNAEDIDVCDA